LTAVFADYLLFRHFILQQLLLRVDSTGWRLSVPHGPHSRILILAVVPRHSPQEAFTPCVSRLATHHDPVRRLDNLATDVALVAVFNLGHSYTFSR
jgi:hypothetical protein